MVFVGLYVGRYDFIIAGQLVPFLGFTPFDSDLGGSLSTFATYFPSLTEIAYSIGLLGFIWTGYVLGIKYLPLHTDEEDVVGEELEREVLVEVYKPRRKGKDVKEEQDKG